MLTIYALHSWEIWKSSFKFMHFKMSSANCLPFCHSLNVLIDKMHWSQMIAWNYTHNIFTHETLHVRRALSLPHSWAQFSQKYISYHIISSLWNWLSLWCLEPWINHLSPVWWYTFWKYNYQRQLPWKFDIMEIVFPLSLILFRYTYLHIFSWYLLIYKYLIFYLSYFMSNNISFLPSTIEILFFIDIV